MKPVEINGQPGIRFEVIGYPWNKKKYGPPYLRAETTDGKYLGCPNYIGLKSLQKMIAYCIKCERENDARKRSRKNTKKNKP